MVLEITSGVLDHVYHEYSHLMSIVVNVTDIMLNNNEETEISYVNIAASNTRDIDDQIRIILYIIAVNKCGQESLTEK